MSAADEQRRKALDTLHRQMMRNDPMRGPRRGRAPGSMKRYEDGSVGSTDKMPRRQREWPRGRRWI